jgi:hypothetical protein
MIYDALVQLQDLGFICLMNEMTIDAVREVAWSSTTGNEYHLPSNLITDSTFILLIPSLERIQEAFHHQSQSVTCDMLNNEMNMKLRYLFDSKEYDMLPLQCDMTTSLQPQTSVHLRSSSNILVPEHVRRAVLKPLESLPLSSIGVKDNEIHL